MAYGVKIKLAIDNTEKTIGALRKQIESVSSSAAKGYAVKIKLTVDDSSTATKSLRTSIQRVITAATTETPIKLNKFDVSLQKSVFSQLQRQLNEPLAIKINNIDASKAISNLRKQLTTMLGGLSVGGLRTFLGEEGADDALRLAEEGEKRLGQAIEERGRKAQGASQAYKNAIAGLSDLTRITTRAVSNLSDSSKQDELLEQLKQVKESLLGAKDASDEQRDAIVKNAEAQLKAIRDAANGYSDAKKKSDEMAVSLDKLEKQLKSLSSINGIKDTDFLESYSDEVKEVQASLEGARSLTGEDQSAAVSQIKERIEALKEEARVQKETEKAIRENEKAMRDANTEERKLLSGQNKAAQQLNKVYGYINNNRNAYQKYKDEIDSVINTLSRLSRNEEGLSSQDLSSQLAEVSKRFEDIEASAKEAGYEGKAFGEQIKAVWDKLGGSALIARAFQMVTQKMREMLVAIREIDAAMTELRKVTDLTEAGYDRLYSRFLDTANRVGATVVDTIQATADFARLGFSADDAAELAEAALIYKNVGDNIDSIATASASLISTMKAFGVEAEDTMHIIDAFNEVGNKFAISSDGIGEALQRSAAALAAAGNTMEESIGLITATNEIVQNPESVGTALKTVSMYLRAAKTEAEEAGIATEGMATSVSKLRGDILALTSATTKPVDIMSDNNTFKSTYEILKEISEIWNQLSDITRANLLEMIGGKRQSNIVASLIQNFDQAEAAMKAASDSAGSAMVENEKYLDSINGKLAKLQAAFETLSGNIIHSSIIKVCIDALTLITQIASKLAEMNLLLPAISGALIMKQGAKAVSQIRSLVNAIMESGQASDAAGAQFKALSAVQQQLAVAYLNHKLAAAGVTQEQSAQIASALGLSSANGVLAASTGTLSAVWHSFTAALMANPFTTLLTVVPIVVTILNGLASAFGNTSEKAKEAAAEIAQAYESAETSYNSNVKTLRGMREEFEKLAEGVDNDTGKNIALTADEYDRYLELLGEIVEISPNIINGYNGEMVAVDSYRNALDLAIQSQEDFIENAKRTKLAEANTSFAGWKEEYRTASKEIAKAFEEPFKDLSSKQREFNFMSSILEQFGIDPNIFRKNFSKTMGGHLNDYSNDMMLVTKYSTEIINSMRASDAFSEEQIRAFSEFANRASEQYRRIVEVKAETADQILDIIQYDDAFTTKYADIVERMQSYGAMDEFRQWMIDNADMTGENIYDLAGTYADELSAAYKLIAENGDIFDLFSEYKQGTADIEAFRARLTQFYEDNQAYAGVEIAYALFDSLTNAETTATEALESYSTELNGLVSTIERRNKGNEILAAAQEEMSHNLNGAISEETFKAISDFVGDESKIVDLFDTSTGVIKLNTEAFKEYFSAITEQDVSNLNAQIDDLNTKITEQQEIIKTAQEYVNYYNDPKNYPKPFDDGSEPLYQNLDQANAALISGRTNLDAYNAEVERCEKSIALYGATSAGFGQSIKDATDTSGLDNLYESLDKVRSSCAGLNEQILQVASGTALTEKELLDLGKTYPAIFDKMAEHGWSFDDLMGTEGIERQEKLLEEVYEVYSNDWSKLIGEERVALMESLEIARKNGNIEEESRISGLLQILDILDQINLKETFSAEPINETTKATEKLSDAFDTVKKLSDVVKDARENGGLLNPDDVITLREMFPDDFEQYFDPETLQIDEEAIRSYSEAALDGAGASDAFKESSMQMFDEAEDGTSKILKLSDAIEKVKDAGDLIDTIESEILSDGRNSIETLSSFIDLYGDGWEEHVSFANGININTEAIRELTRSQIENMEVSDQQKQALIEYYDEVTKHQIMQSRASQAYERQQSARELSDLADNETPIDYESYQKLISVSEQYASAIDYVNGRLILNKDRYDAITQSIGEETKALARENAQTILNSEEYQRLNKLLAEHGSLSPADQSRLDTLNAEIMSYRALGYAVDDATQSIYNFMNANSAVNATTYEGMADAIRVIEETLYDEESDLFGKVGRQQFKEAMKLTLGADVDVDSKGLKKAFDKFKRYFEDEAAGIDNFYEDLVNKGFIDASGYLEGTIDEMARSLGISVEAVRGLLDELQLYSEEDFTYSVDVENTGSVEDATGDLQDLKEAGEQAQTPIEKLTTDIQNIQTAWDSFLIDGQLPLKTDTAEESLTRVSDALTTILNKLATIADYKAKASITIQTNEITTRTVQETTVSGSSGTRYQDGMLVFGQAFAGGSAYVKGGRTLVGELGPETIVDPIANRWYTVGNRGPEFVTLPKNAIVFNAEQTRQLFAMGRTPEIGKALASGNAAAFVAARPEGGGSVKTRPSWDQDQEFDVNKLKKTAEKTEKASENLLKATETVAGQTSAPKTSTKKTTSKSSGGGGSSSTSTESTEKEMTELEKLQEKYEEINKLTEHLIQHQEHLYSVAENGIDFGGMASSLAEQARLYRKMMDDCQQAVQDMIAKGGTESDEELQGMEEAYWSAYDSLYDTLDKINNLYVDALNDKIDGIQGAYDTLKKAADEFNTSGGMSTDTFQELLKHGLPYLSLLDDVGGQYKINEDRVHDLIDAERDQLAIQQALAYISEVRQALADGDANKLAQLAALQEQVGSSSWDAVYAQAALLQSMGMSGDQYDIVINNLNKLRDLAKSVVDDIGDEAESLEDKYSDAFDTILNYVQELIKYEVNQQIKAIEDQIDAYQKIVDLKKESLKASKDEDDYTKSVAEKTKEIAELQARIDQLSLDDSRAAQAERAGLLKDLADLQNDLVEYQGDHAYDLQVEALDKRAEAYEESRQPEIEMLEESVSSAEKLWRLAIERIETGWSTLYDELIAWNTEAGNVLNSEITENWLKAAEAVKIYGSAAAAANQFFYPTSTPAGNSVNDVVADMNKLPKYHSGGVVNDDGSINDDEAVAILRKREIVLDDGMKQTVFELIDFQRELADRLGVSIKTIEPPTIGDRGNTDKPTEIQRISTTDDHSIEFNPVFNIAFEGNGMDAQEAARYGRQIADSAMDKFYEAFTRRGISRSAGSKLK